MDKSALVRYSTEMSIPTLNFIQSSDPRSYTGSCGPTYIANDFEALWHCAENNSGAEI